MDALREVSPSGPTKVSRTRMMRSRTEIISYTGPPNEVVKWIISIGVSSGNFSRSNLISPTVNYIPPILFCISLEVSASSEMIA